MPKKMNREELSQLVAEKITEALPKEFIDECIVEGIEKAILDFKVESYTLAGYKKVRVMIKEMGNLLTARGIELKRRREDGKRMLDMLSQCANRLDNLYGTIKTELETGMEMDEHEEGFIQQVRNLVLEITSHG